MLCCACVVLCCGTIWEADPVSVHMSNHLDLLQRLAPTQKWDGTQVSKHEKELDEGVTELGTESGAKVSAAGKEASRERQGPNIQHSTTEGMVGNSSGGHTIGKVDCDAFQAQFDLIAYLGGWIEK
ncbi:UNVERIFIED_CONTAM: hypothetical protein FKN15_026087 [Acipenser sinensis]